MKHLGLFAVLMLTLAATSGAQSPYAGQQTREVKSLDAATVDALQKGEGHGMALVGELNHYPGPRHVLALADHLNLSAAQKVTTESICAKMHSAAVRLGQQIIEKERELSLTFQDNSISEARLRDLTAQIAAINGELRSVHLSAHLAMRRVLSPEQIEVYDSMRGYGGNMSDMQH